MKRPGPLALALVFGMILVIVAAIVSQVERKHPDPFTAARLGQAGHLSYHLAAGIDPGACDPEGRSLLDLALGEDGSFEAVSLLIAAGADASAALGQESALGRSVALGRLRESKLLIDAGADPDALDPMGRRPLHRVRGGGVSATIVMTLVLSGADLGALDGSGCSAERHLRSLGDPSIDRYLDELAGR